MQRDRGWYGDNNQCQSSRGDGRSGDGRIADGQQEVQQHWHYAGYPHYVAGTVYYQQGVYAQQGVYFPAGHSNYANYAMVASAAPAMMHPASTSGHGGPMVMHAGHYYMAHAPPGAMLLAPACFAAAAGGTDQRSDDAGASSSRAADAARASSSIGDAAALASTSSAPATPDEEEFGWGSLTMGILQSIMTKLSDGEVKHARSVCRHWQGVVDHNLEVLTPNDLRTRVLVQRFPNLKVLHLTNCSNIRNRALFIISRSALHLHTLTLGDDSYKLRVTNEGLAYIADMVSLTSLNLHDCGGVTNNGLLALTKLTGLSTLSLKGCRKLTNGAFEAFQGHSALTSLNLYGVRVTDKGLLPLTSLRLVSLHLGNTRVRDEGLAYLAQITTLQELHFDQEELTDAGVSQLSSLTQLQSLALRDCAGVSGDSLSVLIPALTNLISLDLYKNFTMDDSELTRCLEFLGAVTFLDLRGTPVTEDGLQQLTKLSSLQKLCLAPVKEHLWPQYLFVVSNLTQLTSLSINNCTLISFGQLETLQQLKLLRELDLSHDMSRHEGQEIVSQQPVNPTAINAMAAITSLTSIDLSRRPVHQEHLSALAERLPRLHTLIIVGCPVLYTEVQTLQRSFPDLIIHRKPQYDMQLSCSSSDHGIG